MFGETESSSIGDSLQFGSGELEGTSVSSSELKKRPTGGNEGNGGLVWFGLGATDGGE
jgi:hypothetical protein